MLEYWMGSNDTESNISEYKIEDVLEDPGSATLFGGYPPWLLYFAAGCCVLFMLIGIPGNLITVAALFRTKKLRNATAVFIMNLSVSDLMFCCFNLPLATSTFWHSSWLHGPLLCRLFPLLRYGLVAVSLFTVLAITINRYVMIGHPRLYPKLYKPKYLVLMVLATWVSGFGALIATWFERWGRFGLDPGIGSCSILPDVNGRSPKEFLFILAFLAPCVAIVVCYARIFYIVRKTAIKSRRRDKAAIDLVKASLEVNIKYTKTFEDSAIGSSCGPTFTTSTENGGSPLKSDRGIFGNSSSPKFNSTCSRYTEAVNFSNDPSKSSDQESSNISCSSIRIPAKSEESPIFILGTENLKNEDKMMKSSQVSDSGPRRFTVPELRIQDLNTASIVEEKFDINNTSVTPIDIENIQFIDCVQTPNSTDPSSNEDSDLQLSKKTQLDLHHNLEAGMYPNLDSKNKEGLDTSNQKNLDTSNQENLDTRSQNESLDQCSLRVPKRFIHSLEHSSEHLLSPHSQKYDEISEDYGSSRSESPSERRSGRKVSIFRRESRFKSIRGLETGKMTAKDKKLLKMILVIFSSFLICYLPITVTKTFKDVIDWRGLNIVGYILIYLTTCINPVIYVIMSSEYRSAYKNVLLCRSDSSAQSNNHAALRNKKKKIDSGSK